MDIRISVNINATQVAALLVSPGVQLYMDSLAESALKMQKTLVPVDTGNLSEHLEVRKTESSVGRMVGAFDVEYAAAVEMGHQTRSGSWVPAQPYVRPSVDAVRRSLK